MEQVKILLVEDETIDAMNIRRTLESFNYEIPYTANTGQEAVDKAREIMPDLILMDIVLKGDMDGIDAASKIKKLEIPVIFLTAHADETMIERLAATEPYGYLVKPIDDMELKFAIEMALYKKNMEKELRWSEDRLKLGMDIAKLVYWEYDTETDIFTFDDQFYALYGTSAEEEGGNRMSSAEYVRRFVPPEEMEAVRVEVAKALETDDPNYASSMEHWIVRADGERRYIIVRIRVRLDENGKKIGTRGVNQDITEQKMAEEALKEADQRLADIIDFLPDATFAIDNKGRVISWNRAIEEMTRIWSEAIMGKDNYEYALPFYGKRRPMLIDLVNASDDEITKYYTKFFRKDKVLMAETEFKIRGETLTVWVKAVPLEDSKGNYVGAIEAIRDITDLREAEKQLKKSLDEKEMLLKEIHHRVKNNLMIISSLLNLQSDYIKDKEALDVFKESQNRAKTMALIHERLYQSTDLKNMEFGSYLETLTTELYNTMVSDKHRVKLNLNLDNVKIDINTVVPLGLIVNELVTNSMKYAFPNQMSGHIQIDLYRENSNIVLKVSDDGIGFPEDLDYKKSNSLGLLLINNLTKQIDGELELQRSPGTTFTLTFKEQK